MALLSLLTSDPDENGIDPAPLNKVARIEAILALILPVAW